MYYIFLVICIQCCYIAFYCYVEILTSCIHHLKQVICVVSCDLSRVNVAIIGMCLTPISSLLRSASTLQPSVPYRRMHRRLFHSPQAVYNTAKPGLTTQSSRYLQTRAHVWYIFMFSLVQVCNLQKVKRLIGSLLYRWFHGKFMT